MDIPQFTKFGVVIAALMALLIGGLAALAIGISPFDMMVAMFRGSLGSPFAIGQTLNAAAPLALLGLSFVVGLRARVFNIGLQGQALLGASASVVVAVEVELPPFLHVLACLLAGAIGGALWILPSALLRLARGANELVTTLMMNFVAVLLVSYLLNNALRDPAIDNLESKLVPVSARLPVIFADTRLSAGILVALICVLLVWAVLRFTKFGFKLNSTGMNPEAAAYAGYNIKKLTMSAFLISGALSGLAGSVMLLGDKFRLRENFLDQWYIGIVVGFLGCALAIGVLWAALGLAVLQVGSFEAQLTVGVPGSVVALIQGAAIFCFLLVTLLPAIPLRRSERQKQRVSDPLPSQALARQVPPEHDLEFEKVEFPS